MIINIGIDLVDLDRIAASLARFGDRFLDKVLTPDELALLPSAHEARIAYVGGRFAAKEAALKALGTGMAEGIGLRDVTVTRLPGGRPELILTGRAAQRAKDLGVRRALISLTHSRTSAAAVVTLEDTAPGDLSH